MKVYSSVLLVTILIVFSNQSSAQMLCVPESGDDLTSHCDYCQCAQGISPLETGATGIRFDVRSLYRNAFYKGAIKQEDETGTYESYLTSQIIVNYRFSESPISVSAAIPFVSRSSHDPQEESINVKGEGLGDISALLRYQNQWYNGESLIGYSISAGMKFATGSTRSTNSAGEMLDAHIRPGSGTTDVLFGMAGIWALERVGFTAHLGAGIVEGNGAPTEAGMHKFGNYLLGEFVARYRLLPDEASESNFSLTFGLGGETHARETVDNKDVLSSGETLLYITPGVRCLFSMKLAFDASIEIPIYQYLGWDSAEEEIQLGQAYRIIAGLQYSW
ncbi:MAG: hypothetical protein ABI778_10770 [Ignavibacteriota bacterium]